MGEVRIHRAGIAKLLLAALALTPLLSLLGSPFPASPVTAAPDEVKWSRVNIPTEGEIGNWVLASGSNIQHLTMANDGTLYCYAHPSGTSYTLFKSRDAGYSWSSTGQVSDAIVDIATAPGDANCIYYATESYIYKSTDAGTSFTRLPPSPGGAGADNIAITSLDVARLAGRNIVIVGTVDRDNSQYGGVYTLDEGEAPPTWHDTNIGSYDVCKVAFSPKFASDGQLVAVVTNERDTLVTTKVGDGGWGQVSGNATVAGLVPREAVIAFPDDYDATTAGYSLFVAIDTGTGNGDVYKITGKPVPDSSNATDLNIGASDNLSSVDVSGLAVSGNTATVRLLAGAASSTRVYISTDGGINWTRSTKEPTGQSRTCLLMAPDFPSSGTAYAATTGTESAFSRSADGGVTWNQVGLIDARVGTNGIIDLAVSPNYRQDNTLFMLTFDDMRIEHSLWRSLNGGARWERVFTSTLPNVDSLKLVELSPAYGSGSWVVFLAGVSNGNPAIWKSTDKGQTFTCRMAPSSIDVWTAVNNNTLFLGSYNGTSGVVYRTTDSGLSYSSGTAVGSHPLQSMVISPNYGQDRTILIGNTQGWVYYSNDNGTSFKPLPTDATSPPLTGAITVAFDPEFISNGTVYAASNSVDKGIYRFTINRSAQWESIDGTLPAGSRLSQLAISADGTLYASNLQSANTTSKKGGMERSLNPAYPLNPTFETVTRGLDDGATLNGLWLRGNQLWSIDTKNTRLMTYTDSLALPVTLISPPDNSPGIGTKNVVLEWEILSGATEYHWQLDYDTDFSTVPEGFEGDTVASSAHLPALDTDTTYYWRVRATKPVLSRWSAKWSFTTTLGRTVIAPELLSPKPGASEVATKPLFQWSAMAGAEKYELMVSTSFSFTNPVIAKTGSHALPATAWQSNINLDYNTTYYWKVRAIGSSTNSDWSATGVFTTQPAPPQPSLVAELSPSLPSPAQSSLPDWVIYTAGASLLTIVLLLIILLLVVTITR